MSELAERSGVSPGTIRYYLREGLLGEGEDIVRTSRNMAYYPPGYVERIALIKRLQEERFMPLRVIRGRAARGPRAGARADRARGPHPRARAGQRRGPQRASRARSPRERYGVPRNVLDRLAEIGVLTPNQRGYDHDDLKIIEAIASVPRGRLRGGARLHRLRHAALPRARWSRSSQEEVRALLDRLAGEVDVERAMEIVAAGVEPLRELIGAMHSKLLLAELRRQRGRRAGGS